MSCNSRCTRPANGSERRGSTSCRRRLSAGRKLDTSLRKDVIAGQIWIGSAAPVPKQDRRQNGYFATARDLGGIRSVM